MMLFDVVIFSVIFNTTLTEIL